MQKLIYSIHLGLKYYKSLLKAQRLTCLFLPTGKELNRQLSPPRSTVYKIQLLLIAACCVLVNWLMSNFMISMNKEDQSTLRYNHLKIGWKVTGGSDYN